MTAVIVLWGLLRLTTLASSNRLQQGCRVDHRLVNLKIRSQSLNLKPLKQVFADFRPIFGFLILNVPFGAFDWLTNLNTSKNSKV